LAWPGLNGGALALDLDQDRVDLTLLYSLDASYAAPTLTTDGAGAGLLDYIPGTSFLLFDSYDAVVTLGSLGGTFGALVLLGPAIGNVFDQIVAELEGATPAPTPTPEPTPDPEAIFADISALLRRPDVLEGLALLSGEYALAVFPTAGGQTPGVPPVGGALWLHTTDPDRVIAGLDRLLRTLRSPRENPVIAELLAQGVISEADIADMAASLAEVDLQSATATLNGFDVTTWSVEGVEIVAYGVLSQEIIFLALGPGASSVVTAAAHGDGTLPQSAIWPAEVYEEYGPGGEFMLFVDVGRVAQLAGSATTPLTGLVEALLVGLDLQADGLFQLRMTAVRPVAE
jgi:hypothetical protein